MREPCIRVQYIEGRDGEPPRRVFTIRVNKHGDPTCPTCWSIYKITRGTRLTCRWCDEEQDTKIRRKVRPNQGKPASEKVKEMFRRFAGPVLRPTGT